MSVHGKLHSHALANQVADLFLCSLGRERARLHITPGALFCAFTARLILAAAAEGEARPAAHTFNKAHFNLLWWVDGESIPRSRTHRTKKRLATNLFSTHTSNLSRTPIYEYCVFLMFSLIELKNGLGSLDGSWVVLVICIFIVFWVKFRLYKMVLNKFRHFKNGFFNPNFLS